MTVATTREGRIRVVAVIQSFRPFIGGAQIQLERLLPHLAERGIDVTVLTKRHAGGDRLEHVTGGTIRRVALRGASPLSSLAFVLATTAFVARRRREVEIVHAYGALSEGIVALGASFLGLPVIVRILRTGYWGDVERLTSKPAGRVRWRTLVRRAWFVALSEEGREELLREGVPEARIFRIPNGVDPARFRPAEPEERSALRRELDLPPGVLAVFAGRLGPEKRVDVLVDALRGADSVALAVVGGGPERPALERRAESSGVGDRVRFVGPSDAVADYLRAADVFCLPSRTEGMSNSLLEAMACGLACVAAPVSGVPELLGEGRGVIVEQDGPAAWREALLALAGDPGRRTDLGRRAADHTLRTLTLAATAERLAAAYERMLAARRLT